MNICLYGASSNTIDKKYIGLTEEFGERLAERGHTLVYGAGAGGLMGAEARGVYKEGGKIIGVAPSFFYVVGILFEGCTEMVYTETMRERKAIMEQKADAFVMVPGGIGTFDEFFEILTLKQLGRHNKPIAIFNQNGYYDSITTLLENAIKEGFMTEKNRELLGVFKTSEEILSYFENYKGEEINSLSQFKGIKE
ncbi:MAG: TIGR00730 family Rossman fold protein [Clostridia bacterium]|nr:TIGR00730 family Rossman fold protein [Clostridia bacterium]